jgi:serine/arginine repetitive matrix protein 2
VNGLRDDDTESFYGNRASFASEYSLRESNSEGVQVYFKEHARSSSRGSINPLVPRKKQPSPGLNRPETKVRFLTSCVSEAAEPSGIQVFFSSSAHIGRLIENLSKGLDSGSFNILPNQPQSHATTPSLGSESDVRWTVEERLEHMLGSMGSQP